MTLSYNDLVEIDIEQVSDQMCCEQTTAKDKWLAAMLKFSREAQILIDWSNDEQAKHGVNFVNNLRRCIIISPDGLNPIVTMQIAQLYRQTLVEFDLIDA